MKFCPTCDTRYDEEILRFCTKDGTPLIDESEPKFTELPSESANIEDDDDEEQTLVRQKSPPLNPPDFEPVKEDESPRIVIPMNAQEEPQQQQVRSKAVVYRDAPPARSNTPMIVLTTVLLTLVALGGMGILFWALRTDNGANQNINVNLNPPDANINTNLNNPLANFDYNLNTNLNTNLDTNLNLSTNIDANIKTPTPTRTPSSSPTPSPTETPANDNTNANVNTNARPTPTLPPVKTPAFSPTPIGTPRINPTSTPQLRTPIGNVSLPKISTSDKKIQIKPPITLPKP